MARRAAQLDAVAEARARAGHRDPGDREQAQAASHAKAPRPRSPARSRAGELALGERRAAVALVGRRLVPGGAQRTAAVIYASRRRRPSPA